MFRFSCLIPTNVEISSLPVYLVGYSSISFSFDAGLDVHYIFCVLDPCGSEKEPSDCS